MTIAIPMTGAYSSSLADAGSPSDSEIQKLLTRHINGRKGLAIVTGIIDANGARLVSEGPANGDTVFEIGSLTKVFTSLLLADMIERSEVALDDPAAKYLGTKMPQRGGHSITLVDLATHTSGLPLWPDDFPAPTDFASFSKYTDRQLDQFLATFELSRDIGSQWEYSNLGSALLGVALSRRAGMDYESMVRERITGPLKMDSTTIAVSGPMLERMASGHDASMRPSPVWSLPRFAIGAGALHSSTNDLLKLLAGFLDFRETPLTPAMRRMLATRREGPRFQQALGWWIVPLSPGNPGIVTHRGMSAGFMSNVAYDPKTKTGVAFLSNCSADDGGITWHLLSPTFPLAPQPAERKEIAVGAVLLDRYAGRYQTPNMVITIERARDGLVMKNPYMPAAGFRLRGESETRFFAQEVDIQITFEADGGLAVCWQGTNTPARKIG